MRRKLLALAAVLALLLTVTACGGDGGGEDGRLKIIAANFPGYDLTRAVTGDLAEVQLLLPPGAESHSYEPTPRDILAVQNCDLFVYLGGESDAWVDTILSSLDKPVKTLRMIDCVPTLEETPLEGMEHDHDHGHGHDHHHHAGATPMEETLALMKYMVNHNDAHAQELAELADQLKTSGKDRAYRRLMNAVADFDMANAQLAAVLQELTDETE